jgi:hypothetical protein
MTENVAMGGRVSHDKKLNLCDIPLRRRIIVDNLNQFLLEKFSILFCPVELRLSFEFVMNSMVRNC